MAEDELARRLNDAWGAEGEFESDDLDVLRALCGEASVAVRRLAALSSSPARELDPSAEGERCSICGESAARKIEEVIPWCEYVDPALGKHPPRHPWTAYLCAGHFNAVLFTAPYRERFDIEAKPWPSLLTPQPEPVAYLVEWEDKRTAMLQRPYEPNRYAITPLYEAVPIPQADGRPTYEELVASLTHTTAHLEDAAEAFVALEHKGPAARSKANAATARALLSRIPKAEP